MSRYWSPLPRRTASSRSTWPARATCSPARRLGIDSNELDQRAQVGSAAHLPPARERLHAARLPDHRLREPHKFFADMLVAHRIVGVTQRIADFNHVTGTPVGRRHDA